MKKILLTLICLMFIAVPAMAGIHALIGVGEALITTGALAFIFAARKDLLKIGEQKTSGRKWLVIGGLVIATVLALFSPLASSHPDGLEWVAEQNGFLETAKAALFNIIPDYTVPGISNSALATILAGLVGVIIVFAVAYIVARAEKRQPLREEANK